MNDTNSSNMAGLKQKTEICNGYESGVANGVISRTCGNVSYSDTEGIDFLQKIVDLVIEDVVVEGCHDNNKVVNFLQPEDLRQKLNLQLTKDPVENNDVLIDLCKDIIYYSVKTGHPMFFNQLFQSLDMYGLGGAWLTESLNTSNYTYEVAPVFLIIEDILLQKIRQLVGYAVSGVDGGDGIFCPGGSVSNMYALSLARFHKYPEVKQKGMRNLPEMRVFTSEHGHYSIKKGMFFLGYGLDSLVLVSCDEKGRMKSSALDEAISDCKRDRAVPIMVNATCGTTVLGAFDPLLEIAEICQRHKVWFHVDACWGGGVLVSEKHKHLMKGVEQSDSMAWCFHKMLGSPLQCCPFVTRHTGLLQKCHSVGASYLFQQDKNYNVIYDTGDKSVQCGRKVDALKMWTIWKAKGDDGLQSDIDHIFDLACYIQDRIEKTEGFQSVFEGGPQCTNVCFWYIPERLRSLENKGSEEWWAQVGRVAPHVKKRMMERGSAMIGYQPLGERPNFFRLAITRKPRLTNEHMDKVIREIQYLGEEVF